MPENGDEGLDQGDAPDLYWDYQPDPWSGGFWDGEDDPWFGGALETLGDAMSDSDDLIDGLGDENETETSGLSG